MLELLEWERPVPGGSRRRYRLSYLVLLRALVLVALSTLTPLLLIVLALLALAGLTLVVPIHLLFLVRVLTLRLVGRVLASHCRVSILRRILSRAGI